MDRVGTGALARPGRAKLGKLSQPIVRWQQTRKNFYLDLSGNLIMNIR